MLPMKQMIGKYLKATKSECGESWDTKGHTPLCKPGKTVRTTSENMKQHVPVCTGAKHTMVRVRALAASNGVWTMRLIGMIRGEQNICSHRKPRKYADHLDEARAPGNEQLATINSLVKK
ncbi:hypothetical protein B0H14DRAFT_2578058 [Mycena olivaceomarginata]|nr:hypothetical protein B0H14DRAFT_2578058 [Mycena olivaceomarginata]